MRTTGGSKSSVAASERPILRVVLYYALLAAGTAILWRFVPAVGSAFSAQRLEELSETGGFLPPVSTGETTSVVPVPVVVVLSIAGAFLLMLPVAWIYILTRRKKGFRQSIVQTLLLLPAVVAGVVLIVKNSIALAFSLAGIVAAVSFRNTLRDTKDAVYIFLATGVGIAAGVQAISVAAILSVAFNLIVLGLWWTDFGRAPALFEGPLAERRLERARALANRTGAFVSLVDHQVLESLAPEQLDALVERALRRRKQARDLADSKKPLTHRLRVRAVDGETARAEIERVLGTEVKRWEFGGLRADDEGGPTIEYRFRPRKNVPPDRVIEALRNRAGAVVVSAEVE